MMSSVIPARLVFQCGHAALVSLPRIKGETNAQRADRVAHEKSAARTRACDFCAQRLEVVVQQAAPAATPTPVVASAPPPVVEAETPVATEAAQPTAPMTPVAAETPQPTPVASEAPTPTPVAAEAPQLAAPPAAEPPAAVLPLADWHADRIAKAKPRRPIATRAKSPGRNGAVVARPEAVVSPPRQLVARRSARNGRVASGAKFTVHFQVQTVLSAADVQDALRRVQSLGAIEVLAISQEN
jgi:hypothetical protein